MLGVEKFNTQLKWPPYKGALSAIWHLKGSKLQGVNVVIHLSAWNALSCIRKSLMRVYIKSSIKYVDIFLIQPFGLKGRYCIFNQLVNPADFINHKKKCMWKQSRTFALNLRFFHFLSVSYTVQYIHKNVYVTPVKHHKKTQGYSFLVIVQKFFWFLYHIYVVLILSSI